MPVSPLRSTRARLLGLLLGGLAGLPLAGTAQQPATATPPATNSALDAQLFYQLLIGEIELRGGEAGTAYQVVLDAARRTRDEQLFRRATDIALQARAGDQALAAVMAWRLAVPTSVEAHRYLVQLLVLLNRPGESVEPLRALIELTPAAERVALIQSLPRFFARAPDRSQTAGLLEQALQPQFEVPATRAAARTAIGRAWLAVPDLDKALALARRAHLDDPLAEGPALLAVELLGRTPAAEDIVTSHLRAKPDTHAVRLVYVRALATSQRYADAVAQLDALTRLAPQMAAPWLTLGALHLELRRPAEATTALQRYLALAETSPAVDAAAAAGWRRRRRTGRRTKEARIDPWLPVALAGSRPAERLQGR